MHLLCVQNILSNLLQLIDNVFGSRPCRGIDGPTAFEQLRQSRRTMFWDWVVSSISHLLLDRYLIGHMLPWLRLCVDLP
jgi:hypothetical protein